LREEFRLDGRDDPSPFQPFKNWLPNIGSAKSYRLSRTSMISKKFPGGMNAEGKKQIVEFFNAEAACRPLHQPTITEKRLSLWVRKRKPYQIAPSGEGKFGTRQIQDSTGDREPTVLGYQ
jgi:hypothetical protein